MTIGNLGKQMKIINYSKLSKKKKLELLQRPSIDMEKIYQIVQPILSDIKSNGIKSVLKYAEKFDGFNDKEIKVTEKEFKQSEN